MNTKELYNRTPHFGSGISKLFTYKELETLLNLRPFVNDKRFKPVWTKDYESYTWKYSNWGTEHNAWPPTLIEKMLNRTSAHMADCSRVNNKINRFCEKLEKMYKCPVDCHIYFSFKKDVNNLGKHKDLNDNLISVMEGSLQCEIWSNTILTKILNPGDYAFVPAHTYHRITPLTDKRLSCSFPINRQDKPEHFRFEDRKWFKIPK